MRAAQCIERALNIGDAVGRTAREALDEAQRKTKRSDVAFATTEPTDAIQLVERRLTKGVFELTDYCASLDALHSIPPDHEIDSP